ncbi:unnamed protein product, partial [Ectocarpus sp. 13 AM-2016]
GAVSLGAWCASRYETYVHKLFSQFDSISLKSALGVPSWRLVCSPDSRQFTKVTLLAFNSVSGRPADGYRQNPPKIPPELEGVLREIAAVGVPYYGWGGLKELLAARMSEAVGALRKDSGFLRAAGGKDYQQRRDELVASLRRFDAAPFTLQRLAEVLQDPRRQYSTTHKLINGLERLLSVSSTLPTSSRKVSSPPGARAGGAAETTHDTVNNGAAAAAAAATAGQGGGAPSGVVPSSSSSSTSVVAVKVEEQGGVQVQVPLGGGAEDGGVVEGSDGDLPVDAAVVPADDE